MSDYILPLDAQISTNSFFESRLIFAGIDQMKNPSIRYHNFITAFFLKFFGKIVEITDIRGQTYYLNRGSLINWLKICDNNRQFKDIDHECGNSMLYSFLETVGQNQSSLHIRRIAETKNKLNRLNRLIRIRDSRPNVDGTPNWSTHEKGYNARKIEYEDNLIKLFKQLDTP